MIFGPKSDGTYVVEFRTAAGALAISIPRSEVAVIRHFQERMPVRSVRAGRGRAPSCGALWQVPASRANGWSGRSKMCTKGTAVNGGEPSKRALARAAGAFPPALGYSGGGGAGNAPAATETLPRTLPEPFLPGFML
jgi:hypothetical protein